ncbi:MAG TPA: ABC transporter ATP-binding protein [Pseudonocardiaceae bacterium]
MKPLLSVRDLHVRFDDVRALAGADLEVRSGQTVALVGESGSGKTTLARAVIGLLPKTARVVRGEIEFDGRSLLGMDERGLRAIRGRHIALVGQDPATALNPVVPIGTQVAETLKIHRLARRGQADELSAEFLTAAGLPDAETHLRQYPHELSGGMRQRVLIAIALAGQPRLIIADEPTNAMDSELRDQVLDHLTALTEHSATALVLITHDLGLAAQRAGHVVVMSHGVTIESGGTERILDAPTHPSTQRLVSSAPRLYSRRLRPAVLPPHRTGTLLDARGLTKVFPRRRVAAVDDVSFTIDRGQTLALVGPSGSGKSTIARMLVRLVDPSGGQVLFDGDDLAELRGSALRGFRRRVQMIFQDPFSCLDPRFSAEELIEEPLRAFQLGDRATRRARARELADQVALSPTLLTRRPRELSGGQCQRVAIARAIGPRPELLVCDEPTSSLDVVVQDQVLRLLVDLQGELGLSYLFISHDLAVVNQMADQVAVVRAGRIVSCDDRREHEPR